jgi:hypothetical protein
MAQGVLGHSTTVSGWEMATRGDHGKEEGLTQTHREVQTAGSLESEECGGWRPHPPQQVASPIA